MQQAGLDPDVGGAFSSTRHGVCDTLCVLPSDIQLTEVFFIDGSVLFTCFDSEKRNYKVLSAFNLYPHQFVFLAFLTVFQLGTQFETPRPQISGGLSTF